MSTSTWTSFARALSRIVPVALSAACASTPPTAAPVPVAAGSTMSLQPNWRARVTVDVDDSIVLALPSGEKQLQQYHRTAVFALEVAGDGGVSLRLDALTTHPSLPASLPAATGMVPSATATWTGRADNPSVNAFRVQTGGDRAEELTAVVRRLLPRFPASGVRPETTWTDSATGNVRVDIFNANERRQATWAVGPFGGGEGDTGVIVRMRETFEQMGTGSQSGQKITMTSQGSRSGTYHSTKGGRLLSAFMVDSASTLISLPDTRQVVPTVRLSRTAVQFIPVPRDRSEE